MYMYVQPQASALLYRTFYFKSLIKFIFLGIPYELIDIEHFESGSVPSSRAKQTKLHRTVR